MKTKIIKYLKIISVGFVFLFLLRIGYGFLNPSIPSYADREQANYEYPASPAQSAEYQDFGMSNGSFMDRTGDARKNYATEKIVSKTESGKATAATEQKYEKVANLTNKSSVFDKDKEVLKSAIQEQKALIQAERSYGLPGQRNLSLSIGVPPDNFDQLVSTLQKIGTLQDININKTDKTNEYKNLQVKRVSLEKSRNALEALRSKGGTIDEQINLQNKILEIEQQIQNLGVRLGEFDSENEFCTILFLLSEKGVTTTEISFLYRIRVAFEWTVKYYLLGLFCSFLGVLISVLTVILIEKLKLLQRIWATLQDKNS
ncbi:MAG: DUF4349 domain-containing protein [Bacteroidia bacterium]|nr:DUF4349 domain-containing protein [Bacteroidia bacterium]